MTDQPDYLSQADSAREAYQYFMRTDPDMREFLGPIETAEDPVTKKSMRSRMAKIAMMRGSENLKEMRVYLDPMPHIRQAVGQDLRGWYSNKGDGAVRGKRERPCMTDAILTQPYGGACAVNCSFSVRAGELVDTPVGPRPIENMRQGDLVWGRTQQGVVLSLVEGYTRHWKSEGYVNLKLIDGRVLRVTADHPVYSVTRQSWVAAGNLRGGEHLENLRFGGDGPPSEDWLVKDGECPRGTASPRRTYEPNSTASSLRGSISNFKRHMGQAEGEALGRGNGPPSEDWLEEVACRFTDQHERGTKVNRDQKTHEQCSSVAQREHGGACIGAENSRVEIWPGRAGETRSEWLSPVEAKCIHRPFGKGPSHEIGLGGSDGLLARPEGLRLGLRTSEPEATGRLGLSARLSPSLGEILGGEGLLRPHQHGEGETSPSNGSQGSAAGREDAPALGCPIVAEVTRVEGGLYVHDIQTSTQNFYVSGVLVHNCYINSGGRGYRGSGLASVPLDYGAQVRKQLKSMKSAQAGYFSSFTDPFLKLEDYYHNTQAGATAFVDEGLPIFFLSRLPYPGWAFDLLQRNPLSYMQKSINTPDEDDWRKLSPGAAPLAQHLDEIREARRLGIYVSIQCNPIIPGIVTHDDVERLFEMLAQAGANHVIVKFVEANFPWAPAMVTKITKSFGDNRAAAFRELFVENSAGQQKTVAWEYRRAGHERYRACATRLGMTYATCFEYSKQPDGSHRSVGHDYLTADTCHGHRVPFHTRASPDAPFLPLAECPPSGCLSCADTNSGKPRCGSTLLGAAKALRIADLRRDPMEAKP